MNPTNVLQAVQTNETLSIKLGHKRNVLGCLKLNLPVLLSVLKFIFEIIQITEVHEGKRPSSQGGSSSLANHQQSSYEYFKKYP